MPFPTFDELAKTVLTYKKPSEVDSVRHARALELLADLVETLQTTQEGEYKEVGLAVESFVSKLTEIAAPDVNFSCLRGDLAFPEGTEVIRILSRVRMCANRSIGAKTVTGEGGEWYEQLMMELRNLELAVASAITATPLT